jgi:hypothetical protein
MLPKVAPSQNRLIVSLPLYFMRELVLGSIPRRAKRVNGHPDQLMPEIPSAPPWAHSTVMFGRREEALPTALPHRPNAFPVEQDHPADGAALSGTTFHERLGLRKTTAPASIPAIAGASP